MKANTSPPYAFDKCHKLDPCLNWMKLNFG